MKITDTTNVKTYLGCDESPNFWKQHCMHYIYIFCNHVEVYKLFDVLEKSSKTDPKGICWKHLCSIPVEASQMEHVWRFPDQEEFSFFHFRSLGMRFHTISPPIPQYPLLTTTNPPVSHHPWTMNFSYTQSIFIIKHMPIAIRDQEDTELLVIHLIYLYFFPEGQTLVSVLMCWLPAITQHLVSRELARREHKPQKIHSFHS